MAFAVRFADGNIASETKAEALAEERGEREFVETGIARRLGGEDARGGALNVGGHGDLMLSR